MRGSVTVDEEAETLTIETAFGTATYDWDPADDAVDQLRGDASLDDFASARQRLALLVNESEATLWLHAHEEKDD